MKKTVILLLAAVFILSGCSRTGVKSAESAQQDETSAVSSSQPQSTSAEIRTEVRVEGERLQATEEELIRSSTDIVTAYFCGDVSWGVSMKRPQFEVEQSFLGALSPGEIITVQWYVESDAEQPVSGKRYCMYLTKHISVFYDDDLYVLSEIKDFYDESEDDFRKKITEITGDTPLREYYGNLFTRSNDIDEILSIAENIIAVIPSESSLVSAFYPTENRSCKVSKVYRGEIREGEMIRITFFQDQDIQIGEEILVLLPDCSESAPIYTLAARNSVYSMEEAEKIPSLGRLLHGD